MSYVSLDRVMHQNQVSMEHLYTSIWKERGDLCIHTNDQHCIDIIQHRNPCIKCSVISTIDCSRSISDIVMMPVLENSWATCSCSGALIHLHYTTCSFHQTRWSTTDSLNSHVLQYFISYHILHSSNWLRTFFFFNLEMEGLWQAIPVHIHLFCKLWKMHARIQL